MFLESLLCTHMCQQRVAEAKKRDSVYFPCDSRSSRTQNFSAPCIAQSWKLIIWNSSPKHQFLSHSKLEWTWHGISPCNELACARGWWVVERPRKCCSESTLRERFMYKKTSAVCHTLSILELYITVSEIAEVPLTLVEPTFREAVACLSSLNLFIYNIAF